MSFSTELVVPACPAFGASSSKHPHSVLVPVLEFIALMSKLSGLSIDIVLFACGQPATEPMS